MTRIANMLAELTSYQQFGLLKQIIQDMVERAQDTGDTKEMAGFVVAQLGCDSEAVVAGHARLVANANDPIITRERLASTLTTLDEVTTRQMISSYEHQRAVIAEIGRLSGSIRALLKQRQN